MAELTFHPDADPEITSVDGQVGQSISWDEDPTWADIRGGAGGTAYPSHANMLVQILAWGGKGANLWRQLSRCVILFNTSALPDGASISAAEVGIVVSSRYRNTSWNLALNLYASSPAFDTDLVAADYTQIATTPLSNPINYVDATGTLVYALNAAGLALINLTGITKFGLRDSTYDVPNLAPPWVDGGNIQIVLKTADYSPASVYLKVTFTTSAPQVTTDAATNVDENSATLNGTLDNEGAGACTASFDYGETTAYGTTVVAPGTYNTGESFSKAITGLKPGTTYHYRAKAAN